MGELWDSAIVPGEPCGIENDRAEKNRAKEIAQRSGLDLAFLLSSGMTVRRVEVVDEPNEIDELRDALDRLHAAMDDLVVRGVRAAGSQDIARLTALRDEFRTAGAEHLAERLTTLVEAVTRLSSITSAASSVRSFSARPSSFCAGRPAPPRPRW